MEVNGRICIVTCLCRCIDRCIYSMPAAEINPVPWDVFRPTMRVVRCPALPYPLTFTSKKPIPRTKTGIILELFVFPFSFVAIQYRICVFSVFAPCTPYPLCIVAVAVFAVFVALCPATPCLAFDACLCPVFVCRKRP